MRCLISAMRLLALSIFSFACANELSVNIANFTHQNRRNVMQGRYIELSDRIMEILKDEDFHDAVNALKIAMLVLPTPNASRARREASQVPGEYLSKV